MDPERARSGILYDGCILPGLHCPVCKGYSKKLDGLLEKYNQRGVDVVAVSMDSRERAQQSFEDCNLNNLTVGYSIRKEQAAHWGFIFRMV